jgi:hypothetical protein
MKALLVCLTSAVSLAAGACTKSVCIPGQSVACTCNSGQLGAQACQTDGRAFSPCSCASAVATTPSTSADTRACVPGQSIPCACTTGDTGAQVCQSDGKSFSACSCVSAAAAHQAQTQATQTQLLVVRRAAQDWQRVNNATDCPTIGQLVGAKHLDATSRAADSWGQPLTLHCTDDDVFVTSRGRDGSPGTADDISVPAIRH